MKKVLSIAAMLCMVFLFSCKKDDKETSGSRKVVYKAIGSAGTNVSVAAVSKDGAGGVETFTSLKGETWTSKEYVFPNSNGIAVVSINGTGPSANSTLKVEIWVDGEKKADGDSTGEILSSSASYTFK